MTQTAAVPFRPKPRAPDIDARIRAAIEAVKAVEAYDEGRKAKVDERTAAIKAALDGGASLRELAAVLGISPGRVHQLAGGG